MGFNFKRTYVLDFSETPELEGAVIKMKSASVAEVLDFQTRTDASEKDDAQLLAKYILEWNLVDDNDKPLPVSAKSLLAQEPVFYRQIAKQWLKAVRGISAPLARSSDSGEQSLEQNDETEAK